MKIINGQQRKSNRSHRIKTPSENARISAGLSLQEVARKLGYSPRYLRHLELHGGASLPVARRLAKLYNCDGNLFIHPPAYIRRLHTVHAMRQSAQATDSFDQGISIQTGQRTAAEPSMPPATAGVDTSVIHQHRTGASRRYKPPKTPLLEVLKGGLIKR